MKKKLLGMALAVLLLVMLMPTKSYAAYTHGESFDYNGVKYEASNSVAGIVTALVGDNRGLTTSSVTIESSVQKPGEESIPVYDIGEKAFQGNTYLTSISLPESVDMISKYAFDGCTNLHSITIPANVWNVSDYAFKDSGLTEITFKGSTTAVAANAFDGINPSMLTIHVPFGCKSKYENFLGAGFNIVEEPNPSPAPGPAPSSNSTPIMKSFNGSAISARCTVEKQGALCVVAFKNATPAAFTEALSFDLTLAEDGFKTNYNKKYGTLVINIPKEYQKSGRTFRVIGVDQYGRTVTFVDGDMSDETFTALINVEGYAFSLIYTDTSAPAGNASGYYTVKEGDTLGEISAKLQKSLDYLVGMNNIANPDLIYVGQKIYY